MAEESARTKALSDFLVASPHDFDRKWAEYVALAPDLAGFLDPKHDLESSSLASRATHSTASLHVLRSAAPARESSLKRGSTKDDLSPGARRMYDYLIGATNDLHEPAATTSTPPTAKSTSASVRAATSPSSDIITVDDLSPGARRCYDYLVGASTTLEPIHDAGVVGAADLTVSAPTTCSSKCPSHDPDVTASVLISPTTQTSSTTTGDVLPVLAAPMAGNKALAVNVMGDTPSTDAISLQGVSGQSTNDKDPMVMSLTSLSAAATFNAPLEASLRLPDAISACGDDLDTDDTCAREVFMDTDDKELIAAVSSEVSIFQSLQLCISRELHTLSSTKLSVLTSLVPPTQSRTTSDDVSELTEHSEMYSSISLKFSNDVPTMPLFMTTAVARLELRPLPWPSFVCSQVWIQSWYVPIREKISGFMSKLLGITSRDDTRSGDVKRWSGNFAFDSDYKTKPTAGCMIIDTHIEQELELECKVLISFCPNIPDDALVDRISVKSLEFVVQLVLSQWIIAVQRFTSSSVVRKYLSPDIFLVIFNGEAEVQQQCYSCPRVLTVVVCKGWIHCLNLQGSSHNSKLMHWSFGHSLLQSAFLFYTPGHVFFCSCALVQWRIPWTIILVSLRFRFQYSCENFQWTIAWFSCPLLVKLAELKPWPSWGLFLCISVGNKYLHAALHIEVRSYSILMDIYSTPCQYLELHILDALLIRLSTPTNLHAQELYWLLGLYSSYYQFVNEVGDHWKFNFTLLVSWEVPSTIDSVPANQYIPVIMLLPSSGLSKAFVVYPYVAYILHWGSKLMNWEIAWLLKGPHWANSEFESWIVIIWMVRFWRYSMSVVNQMVLNVYHSFLAENHVEVSLLNDVLVQDWLLACCNGHTFQYGSGIVQWKIAWSLKVHHFSGGTKFAQLACATALQVPLSADWPQPYQLMKLRYWELSWDPYILALPCFCPFSAQAATQGGIVVEAPTYCYDHYTAAFLDKAFFSHDYYIYDGHHSHHHDEIEESHVPWDPDDSTWHRLGVKPNFKEGGLSATSSIQCLGRTVGRHLLGLATQKPRKEASTNRNGTASTKAAWNWTDWRRLRPRAWLGWSVACVLVSLLLPPQIPS